MLLFPVAIAIQSCDKVEGPYGEGGVPAPDNSVTINTGTITGSILDYSVVGATESDTSFLEAKWFYLESGDTSYAAIIFEWNGVKSDSLELSVSPAGPVHFDDTLSIAAGSPYGTLIFHYIADIGATATGTGTVIVTVATNQAARTVLLVDFTGQQCIYCPRGARKATELENLYGEQLIGIAVHAGSFAIPATSGNMYTYDFRTPEATQLATELGVQSYPNGSINFKKVNNNILQLYPAWGSAIANLLQLPPHADITITNSYDETARQLTTTIKTDFIKSLTGNFNLAVYLIEDNIVNWQKDADAIPVDNPNYVHRHVFRKSFNGLYEGEFIAASPAQNSSVEKQYSLTLSNEYNDDHCEVVAFVFYENTMEVVQAARMKIGN